MVVAHKIEGAYQRLFKLLKIQKLPLSVFAMIDRIKNYSL